jgi:hypothetical protein
MICAIHEKKNHENQLDAANTLYYGNYRFGQDGMLLNNMLLHIPVKSPAIGWAFYWLESDSLG